MLQSIRRALSLLSALALLITLSACGGDEKKVLESSKTEKTVVMTVGGFEIPLELYRYVALSYKAEYEKDASGEIWLGEEGTRLLAKLNAEVEENLTLLAAPLALGRQWGIEADDADITDAVERTMEEAYKDSDYDYAAYAEYLRGYNMNDAVYRYLTRNEIIGEEIVAKMSLDGVLPTDKNELYEILKGDALIRVKQILVPFDNGKTREENLLLAEELYRMVGDGADFDEMVQTYGGDLFMFNNPDGYYMTAGNYHEAFEEAAFALSVGEVSGIVETDAGFSIIKRYEKDPAYLSSHLDELSDAYIEGQYRLALEECAAGLEISPTEKLADYTIFNLENTF